MGISEHLAGSSKDLSCSPLSPGALWYPPWTDVCTLCRPPSWAQQHQHLLHGNGGGAQAEQTDSQRIPQVPHSYHLTLAQNTPQAYSPSPCLMVQAGRFITTLLSPSISLVHAQSLQLCLNLFNPMDCSLPASSLHEILQARILEWVAMPSCKGSSQPRDRIQVSSNAGGFFTHGATWEAPYPL